MPSGGVGDACSSASSCTAIGSGANCYPWPMGHCTMTCTDHLGCGSGNKCTIGASGLGLEVPMCVRTCTSPSDCRSGYTCAEVFGPLEDTFMACVAFAG